MFPATASYLIPVDNLLVTGPSGHGSTRSGKGNKAALKKVRSLHAKRMRKLKEKENQSVKSVVVKSRGKHESPTSMITGTPTPLILTEDGKIKGNLLSCFYLYIFSSQFTLLFVNNQAKVPVLSYFKSY